MENQIKELIAKGIKLDYREIYEDTAVILRWGNDVHYFDLKVSTENNTDDISKKDIAKYKKIMETIIELSLKEYCQDE